MPVTGPEGTATESTDTAGAAVAGRSGAWMRQLPNGSRYDFRRARSVEEGAQTLQRHLLHALLLRGGNSLQATYEVIWDLNRHRFPRSHSLNPRGALH